MDESFNALFPKFTWESLCPTLLDSTAFKTSVAFLGYTRELESEIETMVNLLLSSFSETSLFANSLPIGPKPTMSTPDGKVLDLPFLAALL